jgi:hypothetical protein
VGVAVRARPRPPQCSSASARPRRRPLRRSPPRRRPTAAREAVRRARRRRRADRLTTHSRFESPDRSAAASHIHERAEHRRGGVRDRPGQPPDLADMPAGRIEAADRPARDVGLRDGHHADGTYGYASGIEKLMMSSSSEVEPPPNAYIRSVSNRPGRRAGQRQSHGVQHAMEICDLDPGARNLRGIEPPAARTGRSRARRRPDPSGAFPAGIAAGTRTSPGATRRRRRTRVAAARCRGAAPHADAAGAAMSIGRPMPAIPASESERSPRRVPSMESLTA